MNKKLKYVVGISIGASLLVAAVLNFEPGGPRPPNYAVKKFIATVKNYDQLSDDQKDRLFQRLAKEANQEKSLPSMLEIQTTVEERFAVKTKNQLAELFLYSTSKSVDLVPFVDALKAKGQIIVVPKGIRISVKEVYKRGCFLKIADANGEEFFVSDRVVGVQPNTAIEVLKALNLTKGFEVQRNENVR